MNQSQSDFYNKHSLNYLEMALRTDRIERIQNPDGYGKRIGDCGDIVEFFLMVEDSRLDCVSFCTQGCMNTNACCNTVAEFAKDKTIDQAWKITPDQVIEFLETLPGEDMHCAELAAGAFYLALSNLAPDQAPNPK